MERFSLNLGDDRLARLDHMLLVLERGGRVRSAEDVEVRLADQLIQRSTVPLSRQETLAHEQEPALTVLEEDLVLGIGEQVAHAQLLDLRGHAEIRRQIRPQVV